MLSSPYTTRPETVGVSSDRLLRLDRTMQKYVDDRKLAGVVATLARGGDVFYNESFGLKSLESGVPMLHDTIFRIYSMTKPITSVSVMMLCEEGLLLLDDPIAKYIPDLGRMKVYAGSDESGPVVERLERPVTIRDLLTHTSGLSYGIFDESPVEKLYRGADLRPIDGDLDDMIDRLCQLPLAGQPGRAWRYSIATDVLGKLIEVVSGEPFDQFLSDHIFGPLGMEDTGFHVPDDQLDRLAAVYEPGSGGTIRPINTPESSKFVGPVSFLSGGGGLVSTAADYMRFAQMMLHRGELNGERLLGRKTVELMTMNHLSDEALELGLLDGMGGYGFGLGFAVMLEPAKAVRVGSIGEYNWGGAASTLFWIDPLEELIGILMTQFMPSGYYPIGPQFRMLAYQAIVD